MSSLDRPHTGTRESAHTGHSGVPAVIYAAKSSPDEKGSVADQQRVVLERVEREGGRIVVAEPFGEPNVSGYTGERGPQLEAAMRAAVEAAAEHGEAELWVFHSSRLARGDGRKGRRSLNLICAQLLYENVQVRSVEDDEFVRNPMLVGIASEQNHKYSADLSSHVRRGLRQKFERGEPGGGPIPDGYAPLVQMSGGMPVLRRDGKPVIVAVEDPTRSPVIRRIFELAAAGVADANIARTLNRDGLRTQAGKVWMRRRVQDTLLNAFYAGQVVWHRGKPDEERREGQHPALVDLDVFERIQALRAARDKAVGSNRSPGRPNSNHVLAGLAHCGRCGDKMRPRVSPYKRKKQGGTKARWYECQHQTENDGLCDQERIDAEVVDAAFIAHLESFFVDFDSWIAAVTMQRTADRGAVERSAHAERERLAAVRHQEGLLADRYADSLAAQDEDQVRACAIGMKRKAEEAAQIEHRLSELEETLAALGAEEDAPVDAMLDFYNRLSEAVRGRLGRDEIADVNRGLKEVLDRVELDAGTDGKTPLVQVLPILKPEAVALFAGTEDTLPSVLDASTREEIVPPLYRLVAGPKQNGRSSQP